MFAKKTGSDNESTKTLKQKGVPPVNLLGALIFEINSLAQFQNGIQISGVGEKQLSAHSNPSYNGQP